LTTELTLDLMGEVTPGAVLNASASLTRLEQRGGFAQGTFDAADGTTVALGTTRTVYVPTKPPATHQGTVNSVAMGETSASTLEEHLGVACATTAAGAHVQMADPSRWTNGFGILHGGIWACLAEMAASLAIQDKNTALSTARLHTTYLRPGPPGAAVTVSARTYHIGGRLAVTEVLGHTADGTLCTVSTVTARYVDEPVV
jgi:uncharacterized protein (TIGR00369 family)